MKPSCINYITAQVCINKYFLSLFFKHPSCKEVVVESSLTFLTETWPACSSTSASLGCISFNTHRQRKNRNMWLACSIVANRSKQWNWDENILAVFGAWSNTCWWCAAGKTGVDSLPVAQKATGQCRRGIGAAHLCSEWNCMALWYSALKK